MKRMSLKVQTQTSLPSQVKKSVTFVQDNQKHSKTALPPDNQASPISPSKRDALDKNKVAVSEGSPGLRKGSLTKKGLAIQQEAIK